MGACDSVKPQHKMNNPQMEQSERVLMQCKMYQEKLSLYIKALEAKDKNLKDKAKNALRHKQRRMAKLYLRQSKMCRNQIKMAETKQDMIDDQIINMENALNNRDYLTVLNQGTAAIKNVQKDISIEELEDIKEDMAEAKDRNDEIGDIFKEKVDENEAECEEELNQLAQEIQGEGGQINLPGAVNNTLNTMQQAQTKSTVVNNNRIQIKA